ncbi:MAG: GlcG/HbpS family heme-binding protein [Steroidobacteraceae bacterium]
MKVKNCLTAQDAHEIVQACKDEARRNQWNVSIAIVDEGAYLLHLERLDGAGLQTPEIATLKASTAALSRFATKALEDMLKERPALASFPRRLPVQGGLPILFRGELVGALGVSGVKSAEDEQIAAAGIARFQSLNP